MALSQDCRLYLCHCRGLLAVRLASYGTKGERTWNHTRVVICFCHTVRYPKCHVASGGVLAFDDGSLTSSACPLEVQTTDQYIMSSSSVCVCLCRILPNYVCRTFVQVLDTQCRARTTKDDASALQTHLFLRAVGTGALPDWHWAGVEVRNKLCIHAGADQPSLPIKQCLACRPCTQSQYSS